jgi:hypothetical protein
VELGLAEEADLVRCLCAEHEAGTLIIESPGTRQRLLHLQGALEQNFRGAA